MRCGHIFISAMLTLLAAVPLSADDRKPAAPPVEIHVLGEDWSAPRDDVEKVLASTAHQLLIWFPDRQLNPIRVSRWNDVPMTLDDKGPDGEYQVRLGVSSTYWAQYTYQFAHEMCHILANYDHHHRGQNQWFEESLCETSSLFVLSRMRRAWEIDPPYPNWKDWGTHFDDYLNAMLAARSRRLPPDLTMPTWMAKNLPALRGEHQLTDRSKLVAAYLLPIFQDDPQGWESLNWLNLGENDDALEFDAYLAAWRDRMPERHKAFIAKIQMLFDFQS